MKQQSQKYFLLILLIAVLVIGAGFYFWNNKPQTTPATPLVGGDKDSHGCIGSAGYTWCATKNKCLRVWEESCEISSDVYPTYSDLKWSVSSAKTNTEPVSGTKINGYEITATGSINNSNVDASKFFNYYDSKLKALGWAIDNNFAADGVLGSQVGYQKGANYIVLNYKITPGKITSAENEPIQWTCPCAVTYSIFTGSTPTQTNNYFEIKELGLKFKITDDIKDLTYSAVANMTNSDSSVLFSTKSLEAAGGIYCAASMAPLGVLDKKTTLEAPGEINVSYLIESNNLYVSYMGPQATCSNVKSVQDLQTNQIKSLREALKTITKI